DTRLRTRLDAAAVVKTATRIEKRAGSGIAENRRLVLTADGAENFFVLQFVVLAAPGIADFIAQLFGSIGPQHRERSAGFIDIGSEDKKLDLLGIGPVTMIKLTV